MLGSMEYACGFFLFPFFAVVSSSCPHLFLVEAEASSDVLCSVWHVFCEAGSAVDWLACCGLEGHCGGLAAFGAFDLEHFSLHCVRSPRLAWSNN